MATLDLLNAGEAADVVNSPGTDATKLAAVVTAASSRLDELVGPVVRRTITAERHVDVYGRPSFEAFRYPISSVTSLGEYSDSGSLTALTEETATVKPGDSFRLRPTLAEPELGLFGPRVDRRASGRCGTYGTEVALTYVAGRFETTDDVGERYKEACRIMVANLWQRIIPGTGTLNPDYDLPRFPFPAFAIPTAVRTMLADVWQERAGSLGVA